MQVAAIVAFSRGRVIGYQGRLPWHLPEDLEFFRQKTWGHSLVVGRRTYEEIGGPLPGRLLYVVSSKTLPEKPSRVRVFSSLTALWQDPLVQQEKKPIFLAGGHHIYQEGWKHVAWCYVTRIDADFPGDAFFPQKIDFSDFQLTWSKKSKQAGIPYEFLKWERVSPSGSQGQESFERGLS